MTTVNEVAWRGAAGNWTGPYAAAAELDARLGDPADPDNPCGFAAMRGRDERAAFPDALVESAGEALRLSYLPARHGGELSTMDEALAMVRVAARRDITVMPATMFSITAAGCVLLAGSDEQRRRVVGLLRDGGAVGFALSEAEHGSDLLSNTCALTRDFEGALRLDGHKWLVGLGSRCDALLVVARSGGRGPAAFSTVLVEGDAVRDARTGEQQRPAGMRGIDFAGFRFDGTPVPEESVVGETGRGMETAMTAMQLVRTTSAAANLAGTDTALRLALDFATDHVVAGSALIDQEHARRELGTAAAAVVACDALALACTRALHTAPAAASLHSSVVKKVLTELSAEVFARCADVLGTRSQLPGAFETARRDNEVVRYVDTGPVANIRQVAAQVVRVLAADGGDPDDALAGTFALDAPLPEFRLDRLVLSCRRDPFVSALPAVVARADRALLTSGNGDAAALVRQVAHDLAEMGEHAGRARDAEDRFEHAERFCYLHAAACCVHLWWFSRHLPLFGGAPESPEWLAAALRLLLDRARGVTTRLPAELAEPLARRARALHRSGRLVSAVALPLAESGRAHAGTEDDRGRHDG
ncbi:acyl-CoA/acyl-ACP dehydrogenase [Saccharopolyspora erythraea]|uniref:acyl-CoA dehydrogenase family protein n=1 Tax=Saccharopolyspora erythraea TaxID=1836 RepID=UPI001BA993BD|nr:acyl-CoA dehydrogenase family protein [Saccharopolyspora erythraea]QUG99417.1 acyl-CoA/acyl-ACP dehydrogenase [Saccharopolyspora erythraea]